MAPGYGQHTRTSDEARAALLFDPVEFIAEIVRQVVRAELQRAQTTEPVWTSKEDAHRRGFPAPSTLRAWQAAGIVATGRRGRVNLEELRKVMAARGQEVRGRVTQLDSERARRIAESITQGAR